MERCAIWLDTTTVTATARQSYRYCPENGFGRNVPGRRYVFQKQSQRRGVHQPYGYDGSIRQSNVTDLKQPIISGTRNVEALISLPLSYPTNSAKEVLIDDPMKEHVLAGFATGFVSHFEYPLPKPWGHVQNYPLVSTPQGRMKLRATMAKQVLAGNMIGGEGWSAHDVRDFFGGREFYGIPCSATEKGGDPLGRIVHDYG